MKNKIKKLIRWVVIKAGIAVIHVPVRVYNNESRYSFAASHPGMQNQTAVVTGANGSLGRSITARLISEGVHVYAVGRSAERLQPVVDEMNELVPGSCTALVLDMSDETQVAAKINEVLSPEKSLDIWVNCAGGSSREKARPIHEQSIKVIDDVIESNLRICIMGSKVAASLMVKQKKGRIINIASAIAGQGRASFSDYAAAKAGIIGFSRSLALEVGPYGVTVNCVSPGFIQRGEYTEHQRVYLLKSNCMHSIGTPEDIAHAVAFLASPQAGFITGQNLQVDGGRSLGLMGD